MIAGDISDCNVTFQLEHDAEIIADNLKIKSTPGCSAIDKVNEIMKFIVDLELFEEQNNLIYCFKLAKRLDSSMTSNREMRQIIQATRESQDIVMTSADTVMTESPFIMQDEIRLDEKRRDKKRVSPRGGAEHPQKDIFDKTFYTFFREKQRKGLTKNWYWKQLSMFEQAIKQNGIDWVKEKFEIIQTDSFWNTHFTDLIQLPKVVRAYRKTKELTIAQKQVLSTFKETGTHRKLK